MKTQILLKKLRIENNMKPHKSRTPLVQIEFPKTSGELYLTKKSHQH